MGENKLTRLIGAEPGWGEGVDVYTCRTDVLPMTLDWLAAGVGMNFIGRAQDRLRDAARERFPLASDRPAVPPYLHPDGTSILRSKPDHEATPEHLEFGHGYTGETLGGYDLELWHQMSHDVPRVQRALAAAENLRDDVPTMNDHDDILERLDDLIEILHEAMEQDRGLRGVIQDTIDYHRELTE